MAVPTTSKQRFPVISDSATPNEGEDQADEGGEVLEQHHRQLGRLGPADELSTHDASPRTWLVSLIAVRSEKLSSTIATQQHDDRHPPQRSSSRLAGGGSRALVYAS